MGKITKKKMIQWSNEQCLFGKFIYIIFTPHFFSFVQVFRTLVSNSGFEDVIYQVGVCTSGSLLVVTKGWHYNHAWLAHNAVFEAMECLLMLRFFGDINIQLRSRLAELVAEPDLFNEEIRNKRFQCIIYSTIRRF